MPASRSESTGANRRGVVARRIDLEAIRRRRIEPDIDGEGARSAPDCHAIDNFTVENLRIPRWDFWIVRALRGDLFNEFALIGW